MYIAATNGKDLAVLKELLEAGKVKPIIVAAFFFLFNFVGLPTYPSAYDKFLIIVGLVFSAVTMWPAWNWT